MAPAFKGAVPVSVAAQDGVLLQGSWFEKGERCVLALHGIADARAGWFAPMFTAEGYSVLAPDSRAHGASGGDLVTYGLLEKSDVLLWIAWMKQHGCAKIFGMGESLGAAILIQAAGVGADLAAIAAECAYADLQEVAEYRVARMAGSIPGLSALFAKIAVHGATQWAHLRYGFDLTEVSPVRSFARRAVPALLIHGAEDVETPPLHSEQLAAVNRGADLWLVPGARHVGAYAKSPEEFRSRVLDWFARY
jgi:hypothetical protein